MNNKDREKFVAAFFLWLLQNQYSIVSWPGEQEIDRFKEIGQQFIADTSMPDDDD